MVLKNKLNISLRLIIAILLFLLTLFTFVYIADEIVLENETHLDETIITDLSAYHSPAATSAMTIFTFFGSSFFLLPAYILIVLFYWIKKNKRLALNVAIIGLTSTAVLFSLKYIFKRSRPLDPLIQHVAGFSFPSGHSFSSFTFYGLMAYLLWQTQLSAAWKIITSMLLFLLAATIAFSRVYLRVHFPSDIIAGFCLSVVWLILAFWILGRKKSESRVESI